MKRDFNKEKIMATKIEKIKVLEENGIEWMIDNSRNVCGLWKMSTASGDDCSEWLLYDEIIHALNQTPHNHD